MDRNGGNCAFGRAAREAYRNNVSRTAQKEKGNSALFPVEVAMANFGFDPGAFNGSIQDQFGQTGNFGNTYGFTDPFGNGFGGSYPDGSLPALPSLSSGSTAASSGVAPTSPQSAGQPNNPLQFTTPDTSGASQSGTGGTIADYFIRAVVIILGFIFVAVGLNMFRSS